MTTPGRGDGLIRPLNAPSGQQLLTGVQPGVTGGVVLAQYVIIFGQATGQQSGGLFIYEGSPGPGNPPVYSDTNATEDPYGNAVAAGIWAGQFGSIQVGLQTDQAAGTADIFWVPSTAAAFAASAGIFQSGGQAILQIFGSETTDNPAANSDYVALYLWDHGSATGPGASAALQGWFFDSTSGAPHNFFSGNYEGLVIPAASVTAIQPGTGTGPTTAGVFQPETWHNITVDAGWTVVNQPQYRLLPDGNIQVRGLITRAATAAQTNINNSNPVPSAYWPAVTRYYRTPQAADLAGAVQAQNGGVFVMRASGFNATQAIMDGIYSV